MTSENFRAFSARLLAEKGLSFPTHLPLIDEMRPKNEAQIVDRLLCLNLCAASSYGFPKQRALEWAQREALTTSFEQDELDFLQGESSGERFRYQIEGMFALHWSLGLEPQLDWFKAVDAGFVLRLPNLRSNESSKSLRSRASLKPRDEIMQATDLAYCLHWIAEDGAFARAAPRLLIETYVVLERRRALDWLTGTDCWYSVSLDT